MPANSIQLQSTRAHLHSTVSPKAANGSPAKLTFKTSFSTLNTHANAKKSKITCCAWAINGLKALGRFLLCILSCGCLPRKEKKKNLTLDKQPEQSIPNFSKEKKKPADKTSKHATVHFASTVETNTEKATAHIANVPTKTYPQAQLAPPPSLQKSTTIDWTKEWPKKLEELGEIVWPLNQAKNTPKISDEVTESVTKQLKELLAMPGVRKAITTSYRGINTPPSSQDLNTLLAISGLFTLLRRFLPEDSLYIELSKAKITQPKLTVEPLDRKRSMSVSSTTAEPSKRDASNEEALNRAFNKYTTQINTIEKLEKHYDQQRTQERTLWECFEDLRIINNNLRKGNQRIHKSQFSQTYEAFKNLVVNQLEFFRKLDERNNLLLQSLSRRINAEIRAYDNINSTASKEDLKAARQSILALCNRFDQVFNKYHGISQRRAKIVENAFRTYKLARANIPPFSNRTQ